MRILFWTDGFYPTFGGRETQLLQAVTLLAQKGHECLVLAQSTKDSLEEEKLTERMWIRRFDFNAMIEGRREIVSDLRTYLEQMKIAFDPHLIQLDSGTGCSLLAFSLFHRFFCCPKILTVHGPCQHDRWLPAITESLLPLFHRVVGVSQWVIDGLKTRFPFLNAKLKLIYNGLSAPVQTPRPNSFDPPRIFLCGRLSSEKGFPFALRCFARLKEQGSRAELEIAGDGAQREFLEKQVLELQLSSSVRFLGVLRGDALAEAYQRASLILVPSFIESFSLVTLEAMQHGRAVIASSVGGIPEVLVDKVTGLLVPPKQSEALIFALNECLKDPNRCSEMGREGYKRAIARFSLERHVDEYEALYDECCSACV